MKRSALGNRRQTAIGWILLIMTSASLACQAAARIIPTAVPPTASPSPTRVPTRTPKPTLTPTPLPDISGIMLTEADLPKGFRSREIRGLDAAELKKMDMVPEDFFLFQNDQALQTISGYRVLLKDPLARELADADIADQEQIKGYIASWSGADDILNSKPLNGFEQIGDSRMAISLGYASGKRGFRVDGVVLRRGSIYVLLTIDYRDGSSPLIKLKDLAAIFDKRIQEYPAVSH